MRIALKEPLHNISDSILNRVISKSIQADLKKYKMGKRGETCIFSKNLILPAYQRTPSMN